MTINPSGLWKKVGIPPKEVLNFIKKVENNLYISFNRIHFHSSWNHNPSEQINFFKILGKILSSISETYKKRIKFIDISCGYCPQMGEWL